MRPSAKEAESDYRQQTRQREIWVNRCRRIGDFIMVQLIVAGMNDLAERLQRCLSNVEIRPYQGQARVRRLYPCKLRFICPLCHYFWASGHVRNHSARLRRAAYGGHRLFYLTLTVPTVPLLTRAVLAALWCAWKKLRRQKLFNGCFATLAAMEIRKGANGWQAHLHIIVTADSMIPVDAIRSEWYGLTFGLVVDIKPVEVATVERVIRYSLKRPKIKKAEDLRALIGAAKGQNFVRATGQARQSTRRRDRSF